MNWDDYRYILTIARAGNLPQTAKLLEVSISTVFRRLEKIEQGSGGSLFHRSNNGYIPNDICQELIAVAQKIENEINSTQRLISELDEELTGTIKITSTEVITTFFLARQLHQMQQMHPQLKFELLSENKTLDLDKQEADISLRPVRPENPELFGRKISNIQWGIYGNSQLENPPHFNQLSEIQRFNFVAFNNIELLEQKTNIQSINVNCTSNSLVSNASIAATSNNLALLPCIIGEQWPGLGCYAAPIENSSGELWLICHKDLRRNAKIRAVFDFIVKAAEKEQAFFVRAAK